MFADTEIPDPFDFSKIRFSGIPLDWATAAIVAISNMFHPEYNPLAEIFGGDVLRPCILSTDQKTQVFAELTQKLTALAAPYLDAPERLATIDDYSVYHYGPERVAWWFIHGSQPVPVQGRAMHALFKALACCGETGLDQVARFVSDSRYYVAAAALTSLHSFHHYDQFAQATRRRMLSIAQSQLENPNPWVRHAAAYTSRAYLDSLDIVPYRDAHYATKRRVSTLTRILGRLGQALGEVESSLQELVHTAGLSTDVQSHVEALRTYALSVSNPDPGEFQAPVDASQLCDRYNKLANRASDHMYEINRLTTSRVDSLVSCAQSGEPLVADDLPFVHLLIRKIASNMMKDLESSSSTQASENALQNIAGFCSSFGQEAIFNNSIDGVVAALRSSISTAGLGRDTDWTHHAQVQRRVETVITFLMSLKPLTGEQPAPKLRSGPSGSDNTKPMRRIS